MDAEWERRGGEGDVGYLRRKWGQQVGGGRVQKRGGKVHYPTC